MKELPAALFLRPTGFDTLSTRLWSHVSSLSYAAAAPYAVTIVVLAAVPTAVLATIDGALVASVDESGRTVPMDIVPSVMAGRL